MPAAVIEPAVDGETDHRTLELLPDTVATNATVCDGPRVAVAGETVTVGAVVGDNTDTATALPEDEAANPFRRPIAAEVTPDASVPVTVAIVPLGIILAFGPAAMHV